MFKNDNPDVRWENPNHPQNHIINPRGAVTVNWNKLIKWIFEDGLVTESKVLGITDFYRRMFNYVPDFTEGIRDRFFPKDGIYKIYHDDNTKNKISEGRLVYDMDFDMGNGTINHEEDINFNEHYDYDKGIAILETIHRETEARYGKDKNSEKDVTNNAIKHFEVLIENFDSFKPRVETFLEDYVRPRARKDGRGKNANVKHNARGKRDGWTGNGWDGKWGAEPLLKLMEKYRTHLNDEYNKYRDVQNKVRKVNRMDDALMGRGRGGKKKVKSKTSKRKTSKRKTSKRKTSKKRGSKRKSRKN
jgi:hypothetical protein